jgi:hypothetical protein
MRPSRAILQSLLNRTEFALRQFPFAIVLAALLAPATARAQLMLPGALQAQPSVDPNASSNSPGAAQRKPKLARPKPPSVETILGRELARDGSAGIISFRTTSEKGVEITKLSLGEGMSHSAEPCQVDVVAEGAIQARFGGRPNGVSLRGEHPSLSIFS